MPKPVDPQGRAFQSAVGVLERSWSALILNVLQAGALRFGEITERTQGPAAKVLSARLKELEGGGLVVRNVVEGPPLRVTYELTHKGRAFKQLAEAIERWGRELVD
jgi:DNA-binding HxlR family transcriptional regulator